MCYQNDYMRDFFYYNQNPNQNINMNYGYMPNNNMMRNNNNNIENLYPNIYKILRPVVRKVVLGSNYQYLTEEVISNMVDTVYNIVEGDKNSRTTEVNVENAETRRSNSSVASNTTQTQGSTQSRSNQSNNIEYNNLLKDIIRILVLQEILNRSGWGRNYNNMNMGMNINSEYQNQMCQNQGYQGCCGGVNYM